jgi:hypothetical protein
VLLLHDLMQAPTEYVPLFQMHPSPASAGAGAAKMYTAIATTGSNELNTNVALSFFVMGPST